MCLCFACVSARDALGDGSGAGRRLERRFTKRVKRRHCHRDVVNFYLNPYEPCPQSIYLKVRATLWRRPEHEAKLGHSSSALLFAFPSPRLAHICYPARVRGDDLSSVSCHRPCLRRKARRPLQLLPRLCLLHQLAACMMDEAPGVNPMDDGARPTLARPNRHAWPALASYGLRSRPMAAGGTGCGRIVCEPPPPPPLLTVLARCTSAYD